MIREVIIKEMSDRKMRKSQLSDITGISRNQVGKFINGRSLGIDNLNKICDALNLRLTKHYSE